MKTKHIKGKTIVLALVLLLSLSALFLMMFSLAAYTDVSKTKKVISTSETQVLFSAKYLDTYPISQTDPSGVPVTSVSASEKISTAITNHLLGNSTVTNEADIKYTLEIRIIPQEGVTVADSDCRAELGGTNLTFSSGVAISTERTLHGGTIPHEDELDIYVPVGTVLSVKAIPSDGTATSNKMLFGLLKRLYVEPGSTVISTRWSGAVIDEGGTISDYAGFVYRITRTAGGAEAGKIRVYWDSRQLESEASPVGFTEICTAPAAATQADLEAVFDLPTGLAADKWTDWKYIEITTSTTSPESFNIRFYRAAGFNLTETDVVSILTAASNPYYLCKYTKDA